MMNMPNTQFCHFEFEKFTPSSLQKAADWAWACLERLASSFCISFCQTETKCILPDDIRNNAKIEFNEAQKDFHKALAYLHVIDVANDECPACLVTRALQTFPLIASKSEVTPVSEIKMNGVDCYPEVVPMGLNANKSFPCCVIDTCVGDSEHVIENRCREMALLNLNLDELPPMPPWEYENIKRAFLPGQAVVKRLWAIKQGEPEEEIQKSQFFQLNITNAIAATICLRDLLRIKIFYPDAISEDDFSHLNESLTGWIDGSIEKEPLLKKIFNKLTIEETSESLSTMDCLSAFYSVMLLHHPDMPIVGNDSKQTQDSISKLMKKCIDESLQPIRNACDYVINAKLKNCIYPTPEGQQQYKSTSRFFMMLREYWMLCQKAITDRTRHHVAWNPYPLSSLVINLKQRIDTCINGMSGNGFKFEDNVKCDIEYLISTLLHYDVDEFAIGCGDLLNKIKDIDFWLEETDVKLGQCLVTMIPEESTYIEYAWQLIENYDNDAKTKFHVMLNNADKQAARQKGNIAQEPQKEKTTEYFPTPDGARWNELTIQFLTGDTASITLRNTKRRVSYTNMGMARSDNANRTVQWEMLEKFAEGNGYYEPKFQAHREREKQQVSRLGRALKTYFQIDGEPIVRNGQGWKTAFLIRSVDWKKPSEESW